jgi:branched-subunit amino acid ABC-type transport system permease component
VTGGVVLVNVVDGLAVGGLLFLLAVGLTMIFGLVDMLNLAHGAVYMAGGYLAYAVLGSGATSVAAFAGVAVLVLLVGSVVGTGLTHALRPLRSHLDQALLTLGLGLLISEGMLLLTDRGFHSLAEPGWLATSVGLAGQPYPVYRIAVIGISIAVAGATYYVFERTNAGTLARATVDDPEMVAAMGVDVRRVRLAVVVAGSSIAALAGVLGAPLLNLRPGMDVEVLVLALVVVVVGGLGSIKGALVGALIIGQVQTLGVSLVPEVAAYALFGVMALVLLARPSGLFGRKLQ